MSVRVGSLAIVLTLLGLVPTVFAQGRFQLVTDPRFDSGYAPNVNWITMSDNGLVVAFDAYQREASGSVTGVLEVIVLTPRQVTLASPASKPVDRLPMVELAAGLEPRRIVCRVFIRGVEPGRRRHERSGRPVCKGTQPRHYNQITPDLPLIPLLHTLL